MKAANLAKSSFFTKSFCLELLREVGQDGLGCGVELGASKNFA